MDLVYFRPLIRLTPPMLDAQFGIGVLKFASAAHLTGILPTEYALPFLICARPMIIRTEFASPATLGTNS